MVDFQEILARVTIKDILTDCGYQPVRNRMPCPIHGGKNPTSFSFTDHGYCCFSCGACGGLLDLTEALLGINRKEALEYLADKAGISIEDRPAENKPIAIKPIRRSPAITENTDLINLKIDLKAIEILRGHYTWQLMNARKRLKTRTMELPEFYATTQYAEYMLEEYDEEIMALTHEINIKKSELKNAKQIRYS